MIRILKKNDILDNVNIFLKYSRRCENNKFQYFLESEKTYI